MPNDKDTQALAAAAGVQDGVARIEQGTPLTRLHYFDGKFLRADALTLEQDYHRKLVQLSNLAGGWGVVHGLGISLAQGQLALSPGLAITPTGSTVLLNQGFSASLAELIAAAQPAPTTGQDDFADCDCSAGPGDEGSAGETYYEITVGPLQGLCGNEEVYGKLCEDACVTDTQRPYWREGLVLRLRPFSLPLPTSSSQPLAAIHERSRLASAYFKAEPWLRASLLSASGLSGPLWCNPASLYNRDEVPIGLLARQGDSIRFIDAWSARRERMDSQARGYWQGRMRMRPWNVFLAQILQFQCQLSGVFKPESGDFDPLDDDCRRLRELLVDTRRQLELARQHYAEGSQQILSMLGDESVKIDSALKKLKQSDKQLGHLAEQLGDGNEAGMALPKQRMLLGAGFVELPPAGYLPVQPGKQPVNEQLQRMFGEGVLLHFCAARPDFIPHEVEAAQHMERISLTRGLDNPNQKEEVEIFVPNGEVLAAQGQADGLYWFADIDLKFMDAFKVDKAASALNGELKEAAGAAPIYSKRMQSMASQAEAVDTQTGLSGLARSRRKDNGGAEFTLICQQKVLFSRSVAAPKGSTAGGADGQIEMSAGLPGFYLGLDIDSDPFARREGEIVGGDFEARLGMSLTLEQQERVFGYTLQGPARLRIESVFRAAADVDAVAGELSLFPQMLAFKQGEADPDDEPDQPITLAVLLFRQGDAGQGRVWIEIDLPAVQRLGLRGEANWGGQPRLAEVGLRRRLAAREQYQATHYASGYTAGQQRMLDEDGVFAPILTLREMAALPAAESPLRLDALNAIATLADYTANPAFLARAKARLFPNVQASGPLLVRASEPWVMFRRRRHSSCDSCCTAAPASTVEAFQTWHLQLEDLGQLAALSEAIDQNDVAALKGYKFKRVNILHYLDESQTPIELQQSVRADWKKAKPAPNVLLGRVWESAPRTGQGWQNHYRLRRLVGWLDGLLQPPQRDTIHALPRAPGPLDDSQFDGGMLLVTGGDVPAAQLKHAFYLIQRAEGNAVVQELLKGNGQAWQQVEALLAKQLARRLSLGFDANGALLAADLADLQALRAKATGIDDPFVLLRGNALPAGRDVSKEHQVILQAFTGRSVAERGSSLPQASFGDAPVATLILAVGLGD